MFSCQLHECAMMSRLLLYDRITCGPPKQSLLLHFIHVISEVVSSGLEGISPLPLPVALLPPLGPGEPAPRCPVGLVVLVAVRIVLGHRERSVWKNLFELGDEEHLQTAACLGHLGVGLWAERERHNR